MGMLDGSCVLAAPGFVHTLIDGLSSPGLLNLSNAADFEILGGNHQRDYVSQRKSDE